MSTFNYYFEYKPNENAFYAFVSGVGDLIVYEILDIEQLKKILKSNEMTHIDDVEGLCSMLIHDKIIPKGSVIRNQGLCKKGE